MSQKDEYHEVFDDKSLKEEIEELKNRVLERQNFFQANEETKEGDAQFDALEDAIRHLMDAYDIIDDLYGQGQSSRFLPTRVGGRQSPGAMG